MINHHELYNHIFRGDNFFFSPCMLPMLPVYISYFAGHSQAENEKHPKTIFKVIAFVVGFTLVFTMLVVFAGTLGRLLSKYQTAVNIISGIIVVLFGLSYLEIFRIPLFKGNEGKIQGDGLLNTVLSISL